MNNSVQLLETLQHQGITHPKVLHALSQVPREHFVLPQYSHKAYANSALPIACRQTISQPYIVALMTQTLLEQAPFAQNILEIGTGSGYQTAILATLFNHIWTIERIEPLYHHAQKTLATLGLQNIHYRLSDGALGWEAAAPFDGILVTAAASTLPPHLVEQLDPHGCMVIPLGGAHQVQTLTLIKKNNGKIISSALEQVAFVPLLSGTHKTDTP